MNPLNNYILAIKVIIGYLIGTLIFTYPLIINISNSIYGIPHDNFGTLWDLWAYHIAIHNKIPLNSFDYINYPYGVNIIPNIKMFTTHNLNYITSYLIPNAYIAFNIIIIIKLVFASYTMFLLLKLMNIKVVVSWIGGCIYAFNPFMNSLVLAYGPNFISVFLPLLVFSIIKFIHKRNIPTLTLMIIVSCLFFGENYYYTYFTFVSFVITSIIYILLRSKSIYQNISSYIIKNKYFKSFTVAILVFLLLYAIVLLVIYLRNYYISLGNNYTIYDALRMSARPIFYFIPPINNTFFGELFSNYYWSKMKLKMDTFEQSIYFGYSLLIIILFGCLRYSSFPITIKKYYLWFISLFFVSIFSALGPMFPNTWDGLSPEKSLTVKNIGYYFFDLAPMFRHQTRYHLITSFSLIVCFILTLNYLIRNKYYKKNIITLIILFFVFIEYSTYSRGNTRKIIENIPQVYKYLRQQKTQFAIAEWPNHWWRLLSTYQSFQPLHQKKRYTKLNTDIRSVTVQNTLHDLGVDYFVFNRILPPITSFPLSPNTGDLGYKNFHAYHTFGNLERVSQWPDSVLYKYKDEYKEIFDTKYISGFDFQSDHSSALKWTNKNISKLSIHTNKSHSEIFLIFTASSVEPKQLELILNEKMQGLISVKSGKPQLYSIRLRELQKGNNILEIRNKDGLSNIERVLNIPDQRNVGIFIGNISYSHYRLSLLNGFCSTTISINNTVNLCNSKSAVSIGNLYHKKDLTFRLEAERNLNISVKTNFKNIINEEILNLSTKLVKIKLFDVEPGEHKINLIISKIYNENILKNDPVTLSSPILINSIELIGHN